MNILSTISSIACFSVILWMTSCDEAPFRTSLPDIPGVLTEIPEDYSGTFLQCNDSLFQLIEKSGQTAEDFLVSALEKGPENLENFPLYSVYRLPNNKQIIFSNLFAIPASRIDSGSFKSGDIRSWSRLLNNLIRLRTSADGNKDTTILLPVWQEGRLFMGLDQSRRNSEEDIYMDGYEIVQNLPDPGLASTDSSLTPGLLKEHSGSHYLILSLDETFFEINQYHLTEWGFTRRVIPQLSTFPDASPEAKQEFLEKLKSIRKISPADTAGNSIVLNPNREHLDPLFNSEWAETTYFMRITPANPWPVSRILIWLMVTVLTIIAAALLLRGRRQPD